MRLLARLLDYRHGEGRVALQTFGILFLVMAGHTMLETARDALFLSRLPPSQLNIVYIGLAGLSFVVTAGTTSFTRRFGQRNTLVCALLVAAYATTFVHYFPVTPRVVFGLYFLSGCIGAVLAPQFWTLAAQLFTVAQGRRLFGPIASGGVLGGVAGASLAAVVLTFAPVTTLLPVAATLFVVGAMLVTTIAYDAEGAPLPVQATGLPAPSERRARAAKGPLFRHNPLLFRLAALVAVSTAAMLTVDYLFKSTAARAIPAADLGTFFARYYAVLNGASLLVQLALAGRLVRRLGVIGSLQVMPFVMLGGGLVGLVSGGALLAVLAMKGVDGSLRHSLNRVAMELLYLPIPSEERNRGKAFIDTVLVRIVQAVTSGLLFVLTMQGLATPRSLASVVAALSGVWLLLASSLALPYLNLFREALTEGALDPAAVGSLDLFAAGALIESMASPEPEQVLAAIDLLAARGHLKLVPALVLRHDSPAVVTHALALFGDSRRRDWIPMASALLGHDDESLRMAALRALAKHDVTTAIERAVEDRSSAVHTYAVFQLALREVKEDLSEHPLVKDIMTVPGQWGDSLRRGLLAAITDSPDARSTNVLLELTAPCLVHPELPGADGAGIRGAVARAMGKIKDPRFIPACIQLLAVRDAREPARDALVQMGEPAFTAICDAMVAPATERRIALQLPMTVARFATQRACDLLVERLFAETVGHVRFRVLRALGQVVVAEASLRVERTRIEALAKSTLLSHLQTLAVTVALRSAVDNGPETSQSTASSTGRLLIELLEDKAEQALDRAFRLLKIAHRREDIHRVHRAVRADDKRARDNAVEFVNTLLSRRDQAELRTLFLTVADDLDVGERLTRAREWLPSRPRSANDALAQLLQDGDEATAAVAAHHAMSIGDAGLRGEVTRVLAERPALASVGTRLFGVDAVQLEAAHG